MRTLITICARGGSKGIPKKNIKNVGGKPLIVYSIETAFQFSKIFDCDIDLSTDSPEIINVCAQYGLTTKYRRPEYLAEDNTGKLDAIKDLLKYNESRNKIRYDYILDLDVTSPLRNINDLQNAFNLLKNDTESLDIFSVNKANRNPYFNMVEQKANGYFNLVVMTENDVLSRQNAPTVYDMNASFYFYRRSFFDRSYTGALTEKSLVYEIPHICFDVDHKIDLEFLSYLIENNKLDFEL